MILWAGWIPRPLWSFIAYSRLFIPHPFFMVLSAVSIEWFVFTLFSLPERIPRHLLRVVAGCVFWCSYGFAYSCSEELLCFYFYCLCAEPTRVSVAMRFSRFILFGGPWLVPLWSNAWPAGVFFLPEFIFFPEEFFFSFSCDELTLLVMLRISKLTYCWRILEATEDLSLYCIFGVSWRSASFDPFLGVPLS